MVFLELLLLLKAGELASSRVLKMVLLEATGLTDTGLVAIGLTVIGLLGDL